MSVLVEKEFKRTGQNGEELQKACLIGYNLLMVHDLWQAHDQILLIFSLREFIKLNVSMCIMIKNVNRVELNV